MIATKQENMPTSIKNALATYPALLQKLLFHRGITDSEQAEVFLHPDYETHLHNPLLMSDMAQARDRIVEAIEKNEHIAIYADYDADGIPGAVILHDFFKKVGYENFEVYLPHRHEEGYGFHQEAITTLHANNTKLIITVDVGIGAIEDVAYANTLDIDVIVTDHHEPNGTLPEAIAVVNPKLGDYPDRMLCGAAVAWKVVCALLETSVAETITDGWGKWLLDMVGIATISDMVPLVGENRVLAHFGLKVLQKSRRPGVQLLFKKIGVTQSRLTEDDISFMLTPRINAASRMSHPIEAFKVLSAVDTNEAVTAVEHLIEMNDERKTLVATTMRKAKATLKKREIREVVVIGHPEWQAGILGLVATKLTEEYNRPVFVWSKEGDMIKGSCRGSNGVSVLDIMERASETLVQFGGHQGAGGFSVDIEKVHFLEDAFVAAYKEVKTNETERTEVLGLDGALMLDDVTMQNYTLIEQCAPFGIGNPKPLFRFENIVVQTVRLFGKQKNHLELGFSDQSGRTVKAIQFFKTPEEYDVLLEPGVVITMLAHFDFSIFRGRAELRLRILDIS